LVSRLAAMSPPAGLEVGQGPGVGEVAREPQVHAPGLVPGEHKVAGPGDRQGGDVRGGVPAVGVDAPRGRAHQEHLGPRGGQDRAVLEGHGRAHGARHVE
jgi:hypothetical protein